MFDYGWGASKYTSKAPYKVGKGTVKFFLREYTNELRQDDAFKGMMDAKYYMKNYGGLAKNLSAMGLGTALNSSSKFMSMPITFGKTNINGDIQVDKRSINERLNTRLNKRLSKYTKQTDSMYNIDFFKEKNYKNLKKAVKNNKIGRSLNSKKGWTNYLGEKGIDKVNVRKYNLIKRPKNKIKRITLLYTNREFLAGNLKKLEYKRDLKKLNKIQNRRIAVKNSLKLVAGDVFRRTSNTISSDYGNIGLSGFDSTLDVSRNVLKAGKSLAYKPAKGVAIKTGRLGIKGAKNKDKIKKGVKAAGRVANPVPKGKRVYNWVKKHRKIYKDHGLISSIKSVSKDIGRNIINTAKRIFKILRGALTMLFTAFTGTMGFFFLSGLVVIAAVLIIVWSNLNPLTIVKNAASTFQDVGVDAGMDNYGDDIKKHFDYLRELNEKLDEEYRDYADVVIYLQNPDNSKAIISLISVEFDNDLREHNHVAMRKRMDKYHEDSHRIVDEYYKTHKVGDEEVVLKYIEVETDQEPSDIVGVDNPYERVGSSLSSGGSSGGTSTSTSSVNTTPTGSVKSDFDEVVEELKLSDKEKSEWSYIISRESGWNPSATNPSSGAYGLGQAYPGNKMATHGSDWKTNPKTQLLWMYDYMNGRYGSITGAYNFWRANQWY
ncbi:hypothetical protein [uncultured Anaerococcus sp.]|uniref:aggregation-promoting factor C-terminal-like domain-containing protein n=1 Tax=uncultured Anaerococcus sp. TaxID=293428 RepID=UPI0025E7D136|nr:hypothetical protein [uncultured Anaerococcus sp.]